MSSLTRAAILVGRFLSGFLSQLLSDNGLLDYHQLNFVSLGSVSLAFLFSLFLPRVSSSIYFDRQTLTPKGDAAAGNVIKSVQIADAYILYLYRSL